MFLTPHDGQVDADQPDQQGGDDDRVEGEEPPDDPVRGVLAAEEEEGDPRPHQRDRLGDGEGDPQACPRQQVVGQRVAGEPVEDGQDQHGDADHPVELPGLAEGAAEEHPAEVDDDGGDEHQRRPVVHLAHDEPGPHREAEVEGRPEGVGHRRPHQRVVVAVVDDLGGAGVEEEREEDARPQQHDEAVEGDLAEQEGVVVGEHLVERGAHEARGVQNPGPIGSR